MLTTTATGDASPTEALAYDFAPGACRLGQLLIPGPPPGDINGAAETSASISGLTWSTGYR